MEPARREYPHKSLIAALSSYAIWGLMPLFWRLFAGMPPFYVFIHRCLWAFPFLIAYSLFSHFISRKRILVSNFAQLKWLIISALLIGANWWIYIYGVESHQVFEMSLGYFFSPILSAAMGVVVLKERLSRTKWLGFWTVVLGVLWYSGSAGKLPIMAIGLALTFSFYGLIRKVAKVEPLLALTTESLVLFILATFYIVISFGAPDLSSMGASEVEFSAYWLRFWPLLIVGGALTAIPLLLFAVGVKGLNMTTMGMLNYISPTGKFLLALLVFNEPATAQEFFAFFVIWIGIAIYLRGSWLGSQKLIAVD